MQSVSRDEATGVVLAVMICQVRTRIITTGHALISTTSAPYDPRVACRPAGRGDYKPQPEKRLPDSPQPRRTTAPPVTHRNDDFDESLGAT